jgi:DNA invertase Pin-like site-specific DNA recombinase
VAADEWRDPLYGVPLHASDAGGGGPASEALDADKVRKLCRSGLSKSNVACRFNIDRTSVRRILAAPLGKKQALRFNYAALPKTHKIPHQRQ